MDEPPSQNVLDAQRFGCRFRSRGGPRCGKPVIDVPNAILCIQCFQTLYQTIMYKVDRHWCLNHGNGCLSERPNYVPLPGIQTYTIKGRPGGAFKASGMFMLGHYCGACSLHNVTFSKAEAHEANTVKVVKRKREDAQTRADVIIDQIENLPTITSDQQVLLIRAKAIQSRLKVRAKKLKEEQDDLLGTLEGLSTIIAPTDEEEIDILN
jgi:hypothetical protein